MLANSQSAPLYPLHVLCGILHAPTAGAILFLAWLHLAWAAVGVYALARQSGAGKLGSLVAGASFALTPFMLDWTPLAREALAFAGGPA